jgi:hypothetical protein
MVETGGSAGDRCRLSYDGVAAPGAPPMIDGRQLYSAAIIE